MLPALVALAFLSVAYAVLRSKWPEQLAVAAAMPVPCLGSVLAGLALTLPAVSAEAAWHAQLLEAIRANAWAALDATDSVPVFHLCAWPLAFLLGNAGAVQAAAAASLGLTLLLAFAVARGAGLPVAWAVLAQALLLALPVTTSRLANGSFQALFGQAFEALLAVHLIRRFGHLDGARDAAAATFFLIAAQAADTGSLLDVALVVLLLAALQAAAGERRRALRLATSYAVAAGAVLLLLHASALPGFVRDVLPHLRDGAPESRGLPTEVWGRLAPFYDTLLPLLALGGLSVAGAVPVHARRYLMAATAAGLLLLVLRVALPVPLVHARDLELLALPVAVTSTLALHRLWGTGPAGRIAGLACLAGVAYFCVSRGLAILSTRVLMPVR